MDADEISQSTDIQQRRGGGNPHAAVQLNNRFNHRHLLRRLQQRTRLDLAAI